MPDVRMEVFRGDGATGLGWVAPIYGRLGPATTLRGSSERCAPFWVITTIDIGTPHLGEAVTSLLDVLSGDASGSACAVLTRRAGHAELTLFRATRERDTLTVAVEPRGTVALTTDAAALHARISNAGRLERVCLVDATVVHFDGAAPVTITCPGAIVEVDVRFDQGGAPVVATAHPTGDLAISFDAPSRPRAAGGAPFAAQPDLPQRMPCVESPASPTR
jgi:hypothetical protein